MQLKESARSSHVTCCWLAFHTQDDRCEFGRVAAEHTYVKVRCEGDRGRPIYATAAKAGEADAAVFEDAVYIFIVLHSDAQLLIKVRDRKESGFYGQVCVYAPGSHALSGLIAICDAWSCKSWKRAEHVIPCNQLCW